VSVAVCLILGLRYSQRGLTRTEVDACDLTFRVLIGLVIGQYALDRIDEEGTYTQVNSPNTGARADVQCISWLLNGCEVELAVEGQTQNVVLKI
jgi:hypothetical protein